MNETTQSWLIMIGLIIICAIVAYGIMVIILKPWAAINVYNCYPESSINDCNNAILEMKSVVSNRDELLDSCYTERDNCLAKSDILQARDKCYYSELQKYVDMGGVCV